MFEVDLLGVGVVDFDTGDYLLILTMAFSWLRSQGYSRLVIEVWICDKRGRVRC